VNPSAACLNITREQIALESDAQKRAFDGDLTAHPLLNWPERD
jgi:hypothetical protein